MIPSQMEKQKKRIIAKEIQGKKGDRYSRYEEEFEYLITSGITHSTHAISNPKYPLSESVTKNLLKLYLNDVGLLTGILYGNNVRPVLNDMRSINLGSVYENAVAQELASHGYKLFYYDNRSKGEVDFLIDDHNTISILDISICHNCKMHQILCITFHISTTVTYCYLATCFCRKHWTKCWSRYAFNST